MILPDHSKVRITFTSSSLYVTMQIHILSLTDLISYRRHRGTSDVSTLPSEHLFNRLLTRCIVMPAKVGKLSIQFFLDIFSLFVQLRSDICIVLLAKVPASFNKSNVPKLSNCHTLAFIPTP